MAKKNRKKLERIYPVDETAVERINIPKKSIAGTIWFEKSLKKTIAMYLIMNSIMLFFSSDYYFDTPLAGESDVGVVGELYKQNTSKATIQKFVNHISATHKEKDVPIIILKVIYNSTEEYLIQETDRFNSLRKSEYRVYQFEDKDSNISVEMISDFYIDSWQDNVFQLFQLIFACLVLFLSYLYGSKDSGVYLSVPYGKIFNKLNKVIRHPIDYTVNPFYLNYKESTSEEFSELDDEYARLGDAIMKYSRYMSYAFGNIQSDIVADKIIVKTADSVKSLYGQTYLGYIVILQLKDIVDNISSEETWMLEYFKKAYDIVQRTTDKFGGASSSLLDGKFILIWRLKTIDPQKASNSSNRDSAECSAMCITCILKIITKLILLRRSYKIDRRLDKKEREQRIKKGESVSDYEDSLSHDSFAKEYVEREISTFFTSVVHCGKVYEHITGGLLKIDVVYMSSNMIMIIKLHKMCLLYDMPIVMTDLVFQTMADSIKKQCRKIDIIKMNNTDGPTDLFSLDITNSKPAKDDDSSSESFDRPNYDVDIKSYSKFRFFHSRIKDRILERLIKGAKNSVYFEDTDIQLLFKKRFDFKRACRKAIDFYSLGAWDMAKAELETALKLEPEDGACTFLIQFLQHYDYKKPEVWRGYRVVVF